MRKNSQTKAVAVLAFLAVAVTAATAGAQAPLGNEAFGFQIYFANPAFFPVVQAYLRTFDGAMNPVPNLNLMNIGIQVDGKNYDPAKCFDIQTRKGMYNIDSLQNRNEAFRTVFVWDCSGSMAGKPFDDARRAIQQYIQIKRPADQVAIIAIQDEMQGYKLVSDFEKDVNLLYQRIDDVKVGGQKTRLYDSMIAALKLCASASQGAINNTDPEYAILNVIVALSDGHDEGSSISKDVLLTQLGSLKPPVPIYALAYSNKQERQHFINMEAMASATFGRYWSVEDSQNFAATLQQIHQINRSDYVVTFRVPPTLNPDGAKHNFAVGIQYPSNSGRFQYRTGEFTAMESPAPLMGGKAKEIFDALNANFIVPNIPPLPPTGDAAVTPPPQEGASVAATPVPATEKAEPVAATDTATASNRTPLDKKDIIMLAAIGAAILFMIVAIVLWVRSNSVGRVSSGTGTGTNTTGSSL